MYWVQLLLRQPREPPVIILIWYGITKGDPLSVALYSTPLTPLAEELRASDPGLLSLLYSEDGAFGGLERRSAQLLKLLMERGPD